MLLDLYEYTHKATDQLYSVKLKERFIDILLERTDDTVRPLLQHNICTDPVSSDQIEKVRGMTWEEIAEALYQLLDDIDTASDMCKEDIQGFQDVVLRIQQDKNLYMYSPDGYEIKRVGENEEDLSVAAKAKRAHSRKLLGMHLSREQAEKLARETGGEIEGWGNDYSVYSPPKKTESKLKEGTVDHAQRELQLAGMFDKDVDGSDAMGSWNILCAEAVIELIKVFADQGHSGASAGMTRELFNKLSNFEALTELTDSPDEWMDISRMQGGEPGWQNRRYPSAFSEDGGKTYYNLNDDCFKFTDEETGCVYTGSPEARGVKRTIHKCKAA